MTIQEKKQSLTEGRIARESPSRQEPATPRDTSIFGGKHHLSLSEHRWQFAKKAPREISGKTGKIKFSEKEKKEMAKRFSYKEVGFLVDKEDYKRLVEKLEQEKKTLDWKGKKEKDKEIQYYKQMGGI